MQLTASTRPQRPAAACGRGPTGRHLRALRPAAAAPPKVTAADLEISDELRAKRAALKLMVFSAQPYTIRYFVEPMKKAGFDSIQYTEVRGRPLL
jgi:hypothetical protein